MDCLASAAASFQDEHVLLVNRKKYTLEVRRHDNVASFTPLEPEFHFTIPLPKKEYALVKYMDLPVVGYMYGDILSDRQDQWLFLVTDFQDPGVVALMYTDRRQYLHQYVKTLDFTNINLHPAFKQPTLAGIFKHNFIHKNELNGKLVIRDTRHTLESSLQPECILENAVITKLDTDVYKVNNEALFLHVPDLETSLWLHTFFKNSDKNKQLVKTCVFDYTWSKWRIAESFYE